MKTVHLAIEVSDEVFAGLKKAAAEADFKGRNAVDEFISSDALADHIDDLALELEGVVNEADEEEEPEDGDEDLEEEEDEEEETALVG